MADNNDWFASGTYYEACNCEAVCPCRKVDGVAVGKATYDTCNFALSWKITKGRYNDITLDGLKVAMLGVAQKDMKTAAWDIIPYFDDQADKGQLHALEQIFLGKAGGNILFARGVAEFRETKVANIELDHSTDEKWIKVGDVIEARVDRLFEYDGDVTCGLPGHENVGQELISSHSVNDGDFKWKFQEKCGFTAKFDYALGREVCAGMAS